MPRFRAEAITIRELESVTIIFKDHETIWVLPKNSTTNIIFHRWWSPRGSYTDGWQDFRRKMFRNKQIDLMTCYRLAAKHHIQSVGTQRQPHLDESKKIHIRKEQQ